MIKQIRLVMKYFRINLQRLSPSFELIGACESNVWALHSTELSCECRPVNFGLYSTN